MTQHNNSVLTLVPLMLGLSLALGGCADLEPVVRQIEPMVSAGTGADALDEQTIASGLKEALRVGTKRTVASTSQVDGYLGNALIRIALPEELDNMAATLRRVGFDKQVDELEVAMNRAAEKASAEARAVFWQAIQQMTISDVVGIWKGNDTAATEYFRSKTEASLRKRFEPIVQAKMQEVGLYRLYNQALDVYASIPFVKQPTVNLDQHVTDKALDGLFSVLATEEAKIRKDPAARTTELLRQVFGAQGK